jgi:hypothetical protein
VSNTPNTLRTLQSGVFDHGQKMVEGGGFWFVGNRHFGIPCAHAGAPCYNAQVHAKRPLGHRWRGTVPKKRRSGDATHFDAGEDCRRLGQHVASPTATAVAPENTLASIRAAKSLGCSWVEVDVMLTKDKVPVIHHDNTLNRCTNGEGNLWDYTVAELGQLDAGSHYDEASGFPATLYPGERIPTLTGLLQCCRDLELGLNLEVKHVTERAPQAPSPREQKMEEVNINI